MVFLLYLAKPTYGGWVTFTAHLQKLLDLQLYKISKTTEKRERPYGYGINYRNISLDTLNQYLEEEKVLITAIDKNFYHVLPHIPDGSYIVIHDPTEVNKKSKQVVLDNLPRLNVITIRKSVKRYLKEVYGINSEWIPHPYIRSMNINNPKTSNKAISISRIDYDKNIDIICQANLFTKNKVEIYGEPNELYIYRSLHKFDSFKKDDPSSMYRGSFPKDQLFLKNLLLDKTFVVDMSTIHNDGGGTQYTFLEAIDAGCVLILNQKWVDNQYSIWQDGMNCIAVDSSEILAQILNGNHHYNLNKILENSRKILEYHQHADWQSLFS